MTTLTAGQVMLQAILPPDTYAAGKKLDKKGLSETLAIVAERYPDRYAEIAQRLLLLGRDAGVAAGGASFGVDDMKMPEKARQRREALRIQLAQKLADIPLKDRSKHVVDMVMPTIDSDREEVYQTLMASDNPLALQLAGAGRGNKASLGRLVGSDGLYEDTANRAVPIYISRSYSQGLSPIQYFASTFGARRGVTSAKLSVASSGYLNKQLNQIAHRMVVVDRDGPDQDESRGLPVPTDDKENDGAYLARAVAGFPRNTLISPKVRATLAAKGIDEILVRSPISSAVAGDGVYAMDVGQRNGGLPEIGRHVGNPAAQAIGEKVTQATLCLAEGTRVRMVDGTDRAIERIKPGEQVWGSDQAGHIRPVTVTAVYDNGLRDCWRTTFRFPYSNREEELISTLDHNLLACRRVTNQLEEALNFTPAIKPVGTRSRHFYGVAPTSADYAHLTGGPDDAIAFVLGLLLGDGCYTEKVIQYGGGIYLSCADLSLIDYTRELLLPYGMTVKKHKGSQYYWRIVQLEQHIEHRDSETGRIAAGFRNPVKKQLNYYKMLGKYSYQKTLPRGFETWRQSAVLSLLAGLMASDGTVYQATSPACKKPHVGFTSTSRELIDGIKQLFDQRLCVPVGSVHINTKNRKRPCYNFTITAFNLVDRIRRKLVIPGVRGVLLDQLLAEYSPRSRAERYLLKRRDQTPVGLLPTYDIEVDHPDHLFVLANGLIVSNSSKHSGGAAGQSGHLNAFEMIDKTINPPKERRGWAIHADLDGHVGRVTPAPQGGQYVEIGGTSHYIPPGQNLQVKAGGYVEAGDQLTDGIIDHVAVAKHKHLGEGRRAFVTAVRAAMKQGGFTPHRRNVELIARGLLNRVKVDQEFGDYLPDDVVPYHEIEANWQPREDARELTVGTAGNRYLERPVLHYTIGTRITPTVQAALRKHGIEKVTAHSQAPPFTPEVVRGIDLLQTDPDWQTRQLGGNLEKGFVEAVSRGRESATDSTSFVPGRAQVKPFNRQGPLQLDNPTPQFKLPPLRSP